MTSRLFFVFKNKIKVKCQTPNTFCRNKLGSVITIKKLKKIITSKVLFKTVLFFFKHLFTKNLQVWGCLLKHLITTNKLTELSLPRSFAYKKKHTHTQTHTRETNSLIYHNTAFFVLLSRDSSRTKCGLFFFFVEATLFAVTTRCVFCENYSSTNT